MRFSSSVLKLSQAGASTGPGKFFGGGKTQYSLLSESLIKKEDKMTRYHAALVNF